MKIFDAIVFALLVLWARKLIQQSETLSVLPNQKGSSFATCVYHDAPAARSLPTSMVFRRTKMISHKTASKSPAVARASFNETSS